MGHVRFYRTSLYTATQDVKVGGVTNELREVKVQQDMVSKVRVHYIIVPHTVFEGVGV